jgi:hypothetical protein
MKNQTTKTKTTINKLRGIKLTLLTLHRDTLVHLTNEQLKDAVGGVLPRSDNSACGTNPSICA